jgi:hypothetical protein
MSDKRIVVSIPTALSFRNVVGSGLIAQLARDSKPIVAAPAEGKSAFRSTGIDDSKLWMLQRPSGSRSHTLLLESLKQAFFNRTRVNTRELLLKFRHRDRRPSLRRDLRQRAHRLLAPLGRFDRGYAWLQKSEEEAFNRLIESSFKEGLARSGVVAGFSTVIRNESEWLLFRAMQALRIPTLTHILSFDNLTSAGYLPLTQFDKFMVWNERMASELLEYYGIQADRVVITGTPQFDFHIDPRFRWDSETTRSELGMNEGRRPYLLYCANIRIQTPREPELLSHVVELFRRDRVLREFQWVVRLHPQDDYDRWNSVRNLGVIFSKPWVQGRDGASFWGAPGSRDIALLTNSILHATLVFSIGSTIALDCSVLDKPLVNIGFHPDKGSLEDLYYHNAHRSHHYDVITRSGATPVASNDRELLAFAQEALREPGARSQARVNLKTEMCGPVDGKAAARIADEVLSFVRLRLHSATVSIAS